MSSKFLDKTGLDTLWAKIKSTFQTLGNLVTAWGGTPSDTKYPSEKLVKNALDGKLPLYKLGSEVPSSQDFVCLRIKANYVSGVNKSQVLLYDITSFADGTIVENDAAYVGFKGFLIGGKPQGSGEVICVKICAKVAYGQITGSSSWRTLKSDSSICGPEIIKKTEDGVDKYYLSIFYDASLYSGNDVLVGQFRWRAPSGISVYSYQNGVIGEYKPNQTYPANEPLWDRLQTFTSNIHANTSAKLATARKLKTNLARSEDSTFDGTADQEDIPIKGTLPIANGGTGKMTALAANNALISPGAKAETDIIDNTNWLFRYDSPSDSTGAVYYRKSSLVWSWIKGKISSVLGLTADSYGGNAATATTAAGYTSGGAIDTALQGKVDKETGKGLSANDYTTAEKNKLAGIASGAEVNVQSDWNQTDSTSDDYIKNKPTVSRYFNKYSGGTSVYGWKIGSTVTRNIDGVSSIITGVFTLALGIRVENAPQESTAVKTMATMVGFFSCYARYESGANVVKARIYTPVSSIFNATYNIKYIDEGNGKFTWVLGFGTGTTPISKDFVHCSVNVMSSINADFENFGDAITSAPTYPSGAYFTVFKSPVIGQNTSGVGDATKPVYADTNGFIKECTSVNADTVDGFHFSTSTSGSATNTVYLV